MKYFIYQIHKNDCGFACIKMMLSILYKKDNYLYIPPIKKENDYYTLLEIKDFAKQYGVLLGGYIINDISKLPNDKKPFIIVKRLENGNKHAILIKRKYKYYSLVYDPDKGKHWISNKKLFNDISNSLEILIVESFNEVSAPTYKSKLLDNKNKFLLMFFELSSIFCYFISAYFIKPNKHFLYPVLLAIAGVLFAIMYRISTLNLMKKFDEDYIALTYVNSKKERKDNYVLLHECKKNLFSNIYQIVLLIASALAVNIVLIIENPYSMYIILASTIAALIEAFSIAPKLKEDMKVVEVEERKMLDNEDLKFEEYESSFNEIKEQTYKIAKKFELKKIIILFILLILTIFMSGIHEQANVYYVLFYFTFSMFTYTNFSNAFKMADKNKINIINETKFLNLINKKEENNHK